jgi:hypothetical protein
MQIFTFEKLHNTFSILVEQMWWEINVLLKDKTIAKMVVVNMR